METNSKKAIALMNHAIDRIKQDPEESARAIKRIREENLLPQYGRPLTQMQTALSNPNLTDEEREMLQNRLIEMRDGAARDGPEEDELDELHPDAIEPLDEGPTKRIDVMDAPPQPYSQAFRREAPDEDMSLFDADSDSEEVRRTDDSKVIELTAQLQALRVQLERKSSQLESSRDREKQAREQRDAALQRNRNANEHIKALAEEKENLLETNEFLEQEITRLKEVASVTEGINSGLQVATVQWEPDSDEGPLPMHEDLQDFNDEPLNTAEANFFDGDKRESTIGKLPGEEDPFYGHEEIAVPTLFQRTRFFLAVVALCIMVGLALYGVNSMLGQTGFRQEMKRLASQSSADSAAEVNDSPVFVTEEPKDPEPQGVVSVVDDDPQPSPVPDLPEASEDAQDIANSAPQPQVVVEPAQAAVEAPTQPASNQSGPPEEFTTPEMTSAVDPQDPGSEEQERVSGTVPCKGRAIRLSSKSLQISWRRNGQVTMYGIEGHFEPANDGSCLFASGPNKGQQLDSACLEDNAPNGCPPLIYRIN